VIIEFVQLSLHAAVQPFSRQPPVQPPPHKTPAVLASLAPKGGRKDPVDADFVASLALQARVHLMDEMGATLGYVSAKLKGSLNARRGSLGKN